MKRLLLSLFFIFVNTSITIAQNVTITPNGITPGLTGAYPRLSYQQILALPSPQIGDIAADLTYKCLRFFDGNKWLALATSVDNGTSVAWSIGDTNTIFAGGISTALDGSGNIYVCGIFRGTITLGNFTIASNDTLYADFFLVKYNNAGVVQWAKKGGGRDSDRAIEMVVDYAGNAYITGVFSGTSYIDNTVFTSAGDTDIFLLKYNTNGALQWARQAGGTGEDFSSAVALDAAGNVYITGSFKGVASFDSFYFVNATGGSDGFIAKYSNAGALLWAKKGGGPGEEQINDIAIDAEGNMYVIGTLTGVGSFTFGGVTITNNNTWGKFFVAKYSSSDVCDWIKYGGASGTANSGSSIAINSTGSIAITGSFVGEIKLGSDVLNSTNNNTGFLARLNDNGVVYWGMALGDGGLITITDVKIRSNSDIYISGIFYGRLTVGVTTLTSRGSGDVFLAKYAYFGGVQWARQFGGNELDNNYNLFIHNTGELFLTGGYSATAYFPNSLTPKRGSNMYIVRVVE